MTQPNRTYHENTVHPIFMTQGMKDRSVRRSRRAQRSTRRSAVA